MPHMLSRASMAVFALAPFANQPCRRCRCSTAWVLMLLTYWCQKRNADDPQHPNSAGMSSVEASRTRSRTQSGRRALDGKRSRFFDKWFADMPPVAKGVRLVGGLTLRETLARGVAAADDGRRYSTGYAKRLRAAFTSEVKRNLAHERTIFCHRTSSSTVATVLGD